MPAANRILPHFETIAVPICPLPVDALNIWLLLTRSRFVCAAVPAVFDICAVLGVVGVRCSDITRHNRRLGPSEATEADRETWVNHGDRVAQYRSLWSC